MTLTRRYRFSASHRLHAAELSEEENTRVYGKCNNPYGHGHDYVLQVQVGGKLNEATGRIVDLETLDRVVSEQVLEPFEHRNLNTDIPRFARVVPTTENVAAEISQRLRSAWPAAFGPDGPQLRGIVIQETRNNTFGLVL
jgi:6-pyruvoyltetrahydropterin/6-carboxytetrahydropterin synthase